MLLVVDFSFSMLVSKSNVNHCFSALLLQCSNESVFATDFHPTDANIVVTCGKSHLCFWTLEKGSLLKKQGLFEVNLQIMVFWGGYRLYK